jgi:hypothetical protein
LRLCPGKLLAEVPPRTTKERLTTNRRANWRNEPSLRSMESTTRCRRSWE